MEFDFSPRGQRDPYLTIGGDSVRKRYTFFRLELYKRVGISQDEVWPALASGTVRARILSLAAVI